MNNKYCISNSRLKELWMQKNKERLNAQILKFSQELSLPEMFDQMKNDTGSFHEAMTADTDKFTAVTENVEILVATDLSEFYFPGVETEICFEMKRVFSASSDISYDEITSNIENDTHIDCSVQAEGKRFDFQIKRYSQKYLTFTTEAMSDFIKKVAKSYGDMSGTILIIVLQPNSKPKDHFDFKEIHKNLSNIKDKISFDEINFIFNDENQQLMWWQVFPNSGVSKKPLEFKSEKYQKVQEESKRRLESE